MNLLRRTAQRSSSSMQPGSGTQGTWSVPRRPVLPHLV